MKKVLLLVLALSISAGPGLALGWGSEGDCPFSKHKSNQEAKTEQMEESEE